MLNFSLLFAVASILPSVNFDKIEIPEVEVAQLESAPAEESCDLKILSRSFEGDFPTFEAKAENISTRTIENLSFYAIYYDKDNVQVDEDLKMIGELKNGRKTLITSSSFREDVTNIKGAYFDAVGSTSRYDFDEEKVIMLNVCDKDGNIVQDQAGMR